MTWGLLAQSPPTLLSFLVSSSSKPSLHGGWPPQPPRLAFWLLGTPGRARAPCAAKALSPGLSGCLGSHDRGWASQSGPEDSGLLAVCLIYLRLILSLEILMDQEWREVAPGKVRTGAWLPIDQTSTWPSGQQGGRRGAGQSPPTPGGACRVTMTPGGHVLGLNETALLLRRLVAPNFVITWLQVSPPEKGASMGTRASRFSKSQGEANERTGAEGNPCPPSAAG